MKFVAKVDVEGKITAGEIYYGNFIWKVEIRENVSPSSRHDLKVVVYDDREKWAEYSPAKFEPF